MGALEDRIAIVTGAGRGVGREHALLLAREGARVVVNDLGGGPHGEGADQHPAHDVVDEIGGFGGEAVANFEDVSDWQGAERMIQAAVDAFGGLDVLVNNAGILRDRMLVNMTEQEWDDVIKVHLKGHFCPTRAAAAYWRDRSKAGDAVKASIINTSSTSGLFGNVGQTNYGAAKSGIASFSTIAADELQRYGVRVNAIAPAARTRLTVGSPGSSSLMEKEVSEQFDVFDPANIAPFVAYLATADCPINGRVFFVVGGEVHLFQPWAIVDGITSDHRWTLEELAEAAPRLASVPFHLGRPKLG
jgi:NAD(P)-dependent dehydrogenase (short-subunit alcohol dehydrogenase family)